MRRFISVLLIVLVLLVGILGIGVYYAMNSPSPTETPTLTSSPTPTISPTPTLTSTPTPQISPTPTSNLPDSPSLGDVPMVDTTWIDEVNRLLDTSPFPKPPPDQVLLLEAYNSWLEENDTRQYKGSLSIPLNNYLLDLLRDVNCLVLDENEQPPPISHNDKAVSVYVRYSRAQTITVTFRRLTDPTEQETRSFLMAGALFILDHQIEDFVGQIYIHELRISEGKGSLHWSWWAIANQWSPPSPNVTPEPLSYYVYNLYPEPNATNVQPTRLIWATISRPAPIVELQLTPSVQVADVSMETVWLASEQYAFYLAEPLQSGTTYTVTITVGQEGNTQTVSWSFTTQ